jgi:hypothetical protein
MHITSEVQVELFHRDDLAVAAACGAALNTEDRAEAWLPNGNRSAVPNLIETLRKPNGGGGLPFAEWCWADRVQAVGEINEDHWDFWRTVYGSDAFLEEEAEVHFVLGGGGRYEDLPDSLRSLA